MPLFMPEQATHVLLTRSASFSRPWHGRDTDGTKKHNTTHLHLSSYSISTHALQVRDVARAREKMSCMKDVPFLQVRRLFSDRGWRAS